MTQPMERVSVDLRVPGVAPRIVERRARAVRRFPATGADRSLLDAGHSIVIDLTQTVVLGETTGRSVRRMFEMTGLGGILPAVERDASTPESSA
jgi:hypothetical protein